MEKNKKIKKEKKTQQDEMGSSSTHNPLTNIPYS